MLVQYRGEAEEVPRQHFIFENVFLKTGRNDVNPTDWKRAMAIPVVKAKVEEKMRLAIIVVESEDAAGQTLKDKPAPEAIAIIKDTFDLDLLKEWRDNEARKTVHKEIDDQIAKIEKPEPPEDNK